MNSHRDSLLLNISYFCIHKVLGTLIRIVWVKKVEGIINIPKVGGAIVAFNHQSYFDFLCFVAICPRQIHFLAAEKFFDHPLWKPLMTLTKQIRVDRTIHDKRLLHDLVHSHLNEGKLIGIFPEGTRSPDPVLMLSAFTGVAKYAIRGSVPVVPVGIRGTYEVMAKHDKRPKLSKRVEIIVGLPISLSEYHHSKLNKKAFRVITDKIMLNIADLSGKKYEHA